jgi:hypothetical protein
MREHRLSMEGGVTGRTDDDYEVAKPDVSYLGLRVNRHTRGVSRANLEGTAGSEIAAWSMQPDEVGGSDRLDVASFNLSGLLTDLMIEVDEAILLIREVQLERREHPAAGHA